MRDHKKEVDNQYYNCPEYYREEFRDDVECGKVVLGMWPTEALLAGGGGIFRVDADPLKWDSNYDPVIVMKSQCQFPDESKIEIDFQNHSQGGDKLIRKFTVQFVKGVAKTIKED